MADEDRNEIREAVENALESARQEIAMAEDYERRATPNLVAARCLLREAGVERSLTELRAMLGRREGLYTATDYARAATRELMDKEAENA